MKRKSKKKMLAGIILLMAYLAVLFGCASGEDEGTGPAPLNKIFLTTSDFQTGGIGLIDLDNLSPWEPDPSWAKDVASPDALAVFFQGKIFVINRMPYDNISVLEFDENRNLQLINQYSVKGEANSANPYDLAFIPLEKKAYLSRYETTELWVINPETGNKIKTIDLSKYADDADEIPEMAFMLVHKSYVYLAIQRLDRTTPWWDPVGESYLLKLNWLTDQVEGKILLSAPNPVTDLVWNDELGKILVGEAGFYGILDGGIDGIDPSTGTAQLIISEEQLGGDISDFVLLSASKGYAGITTIDWSASKVVAFNPSTGEVIKEVYSTNASFPFDLELDTNGRLFITDRGNITKPGVVVIDTSSDQVITNQPIEFTLPPYSLCRLE